MKLAALGAILALATGAAHAEATFDEYTGRIPLRPASQLHEAACDLDIELRGAVATVESRHRFVNTGTEPFAARYGFELPRGATVTGLAMSSDQGISRALPIPGQPGEIESVEATTRPMLAADPALLIAGDGSSYELLLQPIAGRREVTISLRYSALVQIRAGALRLVIPGHRGATSTLASCRGSIHAVAGPGTAIGKIRIGGAERGSRAAASFVVDDQDVVIDAELTFAGKEPVMWTQTEALGGALSATLVTVAAPLARTSTPGLHRALFVIDGSRSMQLVGSHTTARVMRTIAGALPTNATVEAIVYDRTAQRVLGGWRPADAQTLGAIEGALTTHAASNGSDLAGAFELAHTILDDGARDTTLVIVISDGVLGDVQGHELTRALDARTSSVDVLAVVLDPARTRSPGADALRSPVNLHGGSFVEVSLDEIESALATVDGWLRPGWHELSLGPDIDIPRSLSAGSGFTRTVIHPSTEHLPALTGHGVAPIKITARAAPRMPIATLALADPIHADRPELERIQARHPYARPGVSYAVLTTTGKVAMHRRAMVESGGPYERIVDVFDPVAAGRAVVRAAGPSAISKLTLERLFRDQLQPRAYVCYQRALGTSPKLAGMVRFDLQLGRGEVTSVALSGLGDAQLDACLIDAAYALTLPLPDFAVNTDDQTIAHYPLTFAVSESKPQVVLGDADSSSPLDIDRIAGGVPGRPAVKVEASTPLGTLRPTNQP